MTIRNWSTTAANNNSSPPDGWPEGMAPSAVNNSARQMMANVRDTFEQMPYFDYGDTPTRVDADTFTVATDLTARYVAGKQIKLVGATTEYAIISSCSYSAPDTTVNVTGTVPTSLSTVSISISAQPEYRRTQAEIDAGVVPVDYSKEAGDVRRNGAFLDGVTNDTTAIQQALDTYVYVVIPEGTALVTTIDSGVCKYLHCIGTLKTTSNLAILNLETSNVTVLTPKFLGDGKGGTYNGGNTSQNAIVINNKYGCQIISPRGDDLGGALIYVTGSNADHTGNTVSNPIARACNIGINANTTGEYLTVSGGSFTGGNWGVYDIGGNLITSGCNISDNLTGYELASGSNDGHGIAIGCNINHNTDYDIRATDITTGFTFQGCHQYEGDIYYKNSNGIMFKGGTTDAASYYFEGTTGCGFDDCELPQGYANTINNNFNSSPSYTIWRNCKKLTGKNAGSSANYDGLLVGATSAGIVIAAATLAAETTLLLTDSSNAVANQSAHTLYDGYDSATGLYTCRGLGSRRVRVSILLNISNNAADDMNSMYGYIQKNSSGVVQYLNRIKISTTVTKFTCDAQVDMSDTDTLRIRLGSTVTFANSVTVASAETYAIVEGL